MRQAILRADDPRCRYDELHQAIGVGVTLDACIERRLLAHHAVDEPLRHSAGGALSSHDGVVRPWKANFPRALPVAFRVVAEPVRQPTAGDAVGRLDLARLIIEE